LDNSTRVITLIFLTITLAALAILTQFARRKRSAFPLRPLAGYSAIPLMIGESIEAARPLHLSFGGAGVGGEATALAMACAEMVLQVARRTAIGIETPIVSGSDPTFLPLAYGTLYRAYQSRQHVDRVSATAVRWYPSLQRTGGLAFAAALTGTAGAERVSGNILFGSYGAEMALLLDAGSRGQRRSVAGSDQLIGQAVAFGMATTPIIGEEMFVAGAYLGDDAGTLASAVTIDVLRWLVIGGMVTAIGYVIATRLFGGG